MLLFQTRAEEGLVVRIGKQARPNVERRTLHHIVLIEEMLEFHKTRLTESFADVRASHFNHVQIHLAIDGVGTFVCLFIRPLHQAHDRGRPFGHGQDVVAFAKELLPPLEDLQRQIFAMTDDAVGAGRCEEPI